jgi:hypothetical protein
MDALTAAADAEERCADSSARAEIAALAGTGNAKLFHLGLKRCPLHRQTGGGAVRAAQYPMGFPQRAENVFPLGFV